MHRLVTVVAGVTLLAGCSQTAEPRDELQVTDQVTAAGPATSPAASTPAGRVVPFPEGITGVVALPGTDQLALASPSPMLTLMSLSDLSAPYTRLPLPGPATAMSVADGGLLVSVGATRQLVKVSLPDGRTTTQALDGTPGAAAQDGDLTLVPLSDRKAVDVVRAGRTEKQISGSMFSADQVLTTGGHTVVLDRLRTAVFDLDIAEGKVGAGQRAGQGATNATTDRYGRVLVTDTRGGALLAFSTGPILLRQRYPVPGAPYGIAYDPTRDLAWVTLTGRNEVVGYNVAGGEPVEKFRFPTVVQPNSVTVDPGSGRVFVASATGGGVQVMQP